MRRPEGTCPGCWQFHDSAEMCWPPVAEDRRYGDPDEGGWSAETDRLESYLLDISNPRLDTRRGTPGFVVDEAKVLTARLRAAFADGTLTPADLAPPVGPSVDETAEQDQP